MMFRWSCFMAWMLLCVLSGCKRSSSLANDHPPVIPPPSDTRSLPSNQLNTSPVGSFSTSMQGSQPHDRPIAPDAEVGPSGALPTAVVVSEGVQVPDSGGYFQVSGQAVAVRTSMLSVKGQGILRSLKVREGDRVKTGQLLCVLDSVMVSLKAQAAQADQAQALAALEDAQRDLQRALVLTDAGAMASAMQEKAQLAQNIAKLRAEAASVAVRMTRQAMADSNLRAPFSGVISRVLAEEGQFITVMPPSPVFLLVDTSRLQVRVPIPERMILYVKAGLPVKVHLPAVKVVRDAKIDRMAEVIDPMTRSAEAVIYLDNHDGALPAGLFASVVFPTVPLSVVYAKPNAGAAN